MSETQTVPESQLTVEEEALLDELDSTPRRVIDLVRLRTRALGNRTTQQHFRVALDRLADEIEDVGLEDLETEARRSLAQLHRADRWPA